MLANELTDVLLILLLSSSLHSGPPLHPHLNSISRSATTLDVSLRRPFSHFPITNYTLELTGAVGPVCNFTEGSNFTCNLRAVNLPLQCPPFDLSVIAYNRVGASRPSEHITKGIGSSHIQ